MAKKIKANVELEQQIVMRVGNMGLNAEQATRVINAAGWDVANVSMRKAGRTEWSRADYNAACRFTERCFKAVGLCP